MTMAAADTPDPSRTPFGASWAIYHAQGWPGVLPLGFRRAGPPQARQKAMPPGGYTGDDGAWPERRDLDMWALRHADLNVGLRLPSDVIGIDVDQYVSARTGDLKLGAEVLERMEAERGPLPPTWRSTSRGADNPSGVRLYRVPAGTRLRTAIPGGVEIIQRHHRYVCCWPSVHPDADPDTGELRIYRWYDPAGDPADGPPAYDADDIPELPWAWIEALRGEEPPAPAQNAPSQRQDAARADWSDKVKAYHDQAVLDLATAEVGGRHDTACSAAMGLCRLEQLGSRGATTALEDYGRAFIAAVAADRADAGRDNGEQIAGQEWTDMVTSGRRKVETTESTVTDKVGELDLTTVGMVDITSVAASPSASPASITGRRVVTTPASSISVRRVRWLWEDRIALGTLALLAGPEGLGKSTTAYEIAARITRGTLPGEMLGEPKAVLVCATEDSWAHTIVPRLMAHDADLKRVYRIEAHILDDIAVGLSLPADLAEVEEVATGLGAALLILDPLMSRLEGGLDTHKDADVRVALEPMTAMADRADLALLGLIHHNKSGATDPLSLVMASKAFTAVARSVHTVVSDPNDETGRRRLFGTPKNNLGRIDLPTLSFVIEGWKYDVPGDEQQGTTGKLIWGDDSPLTIREALTQTATDPDTRTATDEAAEWLDDYLTIHRVAASQDVKAAGRKEGHNDNALKRARNKLGVGSTNHGFPRRTYWSVKGMSPDAVTEWLDERSDCGE